MKVENHTIEEIVNKIKKEFESVPQVALEIKVDAYESASGGFLNILQSGTRKLWFYISVINGKTRLSFVIAIQDPLENYEINNHHFLQLETTRDMVELTQIFLGLNGRI